ncbi:MAG: hypothetical protein WD341_02730 [Tistlia sp.]|uniref:flagellar basal body-associated protein FliL n=1 Tax=Tistlia sp. TaxID=3057121 RepID=UPI0034A4A700
MRRAILLFLVILLLGGGGIAFWKVGLPYLQEREAESAATAPAPQPLFVTLDPFMVPMIRGGVVTRHLTLAIKLEVRDDAGLLLVEGRIPHLRDRLLRELYGLYALRYVQEHARELDYTKERLMKAGNELLGEPVVIDVLVTGIENREFQRPRG